MQFYLSEEEMFDQRMLNRLEEANKDIGHIQSTGSAASEIKAL